MSEYNTQQNTDSQHAPVFLIEKHPGETLAVLLERFRLEYNITATIPITYAGRLDPMASGLMLLLSGKECKNKDAYLRLDKSYTFQVLFGIATDTYDMLGLVMESHSAFPLRENIERALENIQKQTVFEYPPFSSKPVNGIPLFMHAKEGTLPDIMPTIEGMIKSIALKELKTESIETLVTRAIETIQRVQGDFRQELIIQKWKDFLRVHAGKEYVVATIEATVTSGVYIRSLATLIGKCLGIPALAYSIERNSIGHYCL